MTENKENLLKELSEKLSTGELTHNEVLNLLNSTTQTLTKETSKEESSSSDKLDTSSTTNNIDSIPQKVEQEEIEKAKKPHSFSMMKILYILGIIVAISGVITFIFQIWADLRAFGHIIITLGFGLFISFIGSVLLRRKPEDSIGAIFHFIGALLIPAGLIIAIKEFDPNFISLESISVSFGMLLIFYSLLAYTHKHPLLTAFAIVSGATSASLLFTIVTGDITSQNINLYNYFAMLMGAIHIALAVMFRKGWNKKLVPLLNLYGSFIFLGGAFILIIDSILWQLIYFCILITGIYLSIKLKSRSILIINTLFFFLYISHMTRIYFADSLGWALSLIIIGFTFIGISYTSLLINKKFIKEKI